MPIAVVAISLLLQVGCTGLFPKPASPATLLTLGDPARATFAAPAAASRSAPPKLTLLVDPPRAASGHDSELMAYQRTPQRIDYYARHQWVDTPAHLLVPWLVQALQHSGAFAAVLKASSGVTVDWRLQTDNLQLMHHVAPESTAASGLAAAPGYVTLALQAVLIDTRTRRVLATRHFESRQPAPSADAAGSAAAAQAAALDLSQQIASFCAQLAQSAPMRADAR